MMSRLTNSTSDIIDGKAKQIDMIKEQQIYLKLKTLEDLEDELGCPLDVVFKILKREIIYANTKEWGIIPVCPIDIYYIRKSFTITINYANKDGDDVYEEFLLKDYCKTWWLKGDRSE